MKYLRLSDMNALRFLKRGGKAVLQGRLYKKDPESTDPIWVDIQVVDEASANRHQPVDMLAKALVAAGIDPMTGDPESAEWKKVAAIIEALNPGTELYDKE